MNNLTRTIMVAMLVFIAMCGGLAFITWGDNLSGIQNWDPSSRALWLFMQVSLTATFSITFWRFKK